MNLAFIGLGKMGMGMARNLLRAGHTLVVYNRSREKAEALGGEGARAADSPADACRDAEVVMTMVADDHALEEVVFGNQGIASAMKKDCFTVWGEIATSKAPAASISGTMRFIASICPQQKGSQRPR